ncbi:hypothetical protein A2U01_0003441 [Trifolium medium]|uniref:Uncharacterized protein n=1 Tax=Trifolium medium TaxID=97028 RepID=A0A392M5G8_9FABA|nr:hypothetical protein [Trifolium medium]
MPHAARCQHCCRTPYKDQDKQDIEEEMSDYSPPKLKGGAHLDVFPQLLILLGEQIWISWGS